MNAFSITIICIVALISFLFVHIRPRAVAYLVIFLAPWQGLSVDIGLSVSAFLVVLTACCVAMLLQEAVYRNVISNIPVTRSFIFFVMCAVLWSLVQIPFLPDAEVVGGILRSPVYRALAQIFMFLLTISPVLVVPSVFSRENDLVVAGKVYIWSVVILAALGWLQLCIWSITDWNPMPIGLIDSLLKGVEPGQRAGVVNFAGLTIYRMSSFGGDPKTLGQSVVFAVILIQAMYLNNKKAISHKTKWAWALLSLSAIATMSGSAFYLWVIGTIALIVFGLFRAAQLPSQRPSKMISYFMMLFLLTLFVLPLITRIPGDTARNDSSLVTLFHQRTLERGIIEDFDLTILEYLKDNPKRTLLGVGLGNAHLYSDSYINPRFLYYMAGTAFVAKSGYLRMISELGIFGLCLFIWWVWSQTKSLDRLTSLRLLNQQGLDVFRITSIFSLVALILFLARGYITMQFYLTLGACVAAKAILINRGVATPMISNNQKNSTANFVRSE